MRMLAYYLAHSTWNQLRKFVRTWAFAAVCAVLVVGRLFVALFGWYYARLVESNPTLPQDLWEFAQTSGLSGFDVVELVVGLVLVGIFVAQAIGAEQSVSLLFLQADVNLLFTGDRSPQGILAFRVLSSQGLSLGAVLYFVVRAPFIAAEHGLGVLAAVAIPFTWLLTFAYSALMKMLVYEVGSTHPFFRKNFRWFVFGLLALVGLAFYQTYKGPADKDLLLAGQLFFNAPSSRFVPLWGWTKGLLIFAFEGNVAMFATLLSLNVALVVLTSLAVRRMPVDYYEAAGAFAQEVQMLRDAASSQDAALLVTLVSRNRRVATRDGFRYGRGASVYFFKVLYNRFRFARFGFVTKTTVTYALAALAAGLFVRLFMDEPIEYVPVLVLAAMVFFRTVLSPVTEDIRMATFLMHPEPIWRKLFFSLLGGSCNCALDVAVPLMVGYAAAGFSPLAGLAYMPVLMSVDFFASASGTFADVSIPSSLAVSLKQVIQVLLLYAGLIFDGTVLTSSIGANSVGVGFALVTLLDLVFGATFLGLAGVWLYPSRGKVREELGREDRAAARRACMRVGVAVAAMYVAVYGGQAVLARTIPHLPLVALYVPIYGFGLAAFSLVRWLVQARGRVRGDERSGRGQEGAGVLATEEEVPEALVRGPKVFLYAIPACFFLMYAGNIVGLLAQSLVSRVLPGGIPWQTTVMPPADHLALQTMLVVVASPLMEEFVFRRCVLGAVLPYGRRVAIVFSAVLFALFHTSVSQMCYAFLLGLALGYVYVRTGRLRYTAAIHVLINGMTTIALPGLLAWAAQASEGMDPNAVMLASVIGHPGVIALIAYVAALFVTSLFGLVVTLFVARHEW